MSQIYDIFATRQNRGGSGALPEVEETAGDDRGGVMAEDEAARGFAQWCQHPGVVEDVNEEGGHGVDVDRRVDYGLLLGVEEVIEGRFAAGDDGDAIGHGEEGVGGGGVAVGLVDDEVGRSHQGEVFVVGAVLHDGEAGGAGAGGHGAADGGLEAVGAFEGFAGGMASEEYLDGTRDIGDGDGGDGIDVDGDAAVGDAVGGEAAAQRKMVFIEGADGAVDGAVEFLGPGAQSGVVPAAQKVGLGLQERPRAVGEAQLVVAQRAIGVEALLDEGDVGAEGGIEYAAVVAAQAAEEWGDALGPEVDEAGGGAADDVEAAEASACGAHEFKPEQGAAGGAGERSAQVDVAPGVHENAARRCHGDFATELSQTQCKSVVEVTGIAEQQYFHFSGGR